MIRPTRFLSLIAALLLSIPVGATPCANGGAPYPVQDGSGSGGTGHLSSPDHVLSLNDGRGTGGTGHAQDQDGRGSGGTGHQDGSGMGGTGHRDGNGSGGTGIEGFVTGFGSVCVNGLEVEYQGSALPSGLDPLSVGQRVQIDAVGLGDRVVARSIRVKYVVVGPVQQVNPAAGSIRVLGQDVKLAHGGTGDIRNIGIGSRVRVSGLVAGPGNVVAYKVEPAGQTPDTLSGTIESVNGHLAKVAGVQVVFSETKPLSVGQDVSLQGSFSNGQLQATVVRPEGIAGFAGGISRVILQEAVRGVSRNSIRLGPDVVRIDSSTRVDGGELRSGQMIRVEASVQGRGQIRAEHIVIESREPRDWAPRLGQTGRQDAQRGREGEQERDNQGNESRAEQENSESSGVDRGQGDHAKSGSDSGSDRERTESGRESGGQHDSVERSGKVERAEKADRPETTDRPERSDRTERIERPERD